MAIRETAATDLQRSNLVSKQIVVDWVNNVKSNAIMIANGESGNTQDVALMTEHLNNFAQSWGVYDLIIYADLLGKTVVNTSNVVVDISGREYYQKAIQGETFVSEPMISKVSGNVVVAFATPVKVDGKVVGMIGIIAPTALITQAMIGSQTGNTGESTWSMPMVISSPPRVSPTS